MWSRGEKEAVATCKGRISPRKLNLVLKTIRKKKALEAISMLDFSRKVIARELVKKVLKSAVANAENNHGLDIDNLLVKEATVGKHITLRRMLPRGKGRADRMLHRYSNVRIVLEEKSASDDKQAAKSNGPVGKIKMSADKIAPKSAGRASGATPDKVSKPKGKVEAPKKDSASKSANVAKKEDRSK